MRPRALVQALAAVTLAATAGTGCRFDDPSWEGTNYTCAPPNETCPPGFACIDGRCTAGGGPPEDVVDAAVDADANIDARPQNTQTMRFDVTYDTSILSDAPTQNGASLGFLEMDAAPRRVALVYFELTAIPTNAQVVAAEFHATIFDPIESGAFQLYPLRESWTEDGATWEQRAAGMPWSGGLSVPTLDANALLGEFAPRMNGPTMATLDATLVQNWIAMPATNFGFAAVSNSPDGRGGQMRSSEYSVAAERPYLLVTLVAP